jgi:hypothetical protein
MLISIWTQPAVLAAIVTGAVALLLALWNFISGRKTQIEMELLKNSLEVKRSENDARREYEFEARKRLYQEYEPLLFQLMEASDNAINRIQSLARTARMGDLNEGGWLSVFNYYTKSTIYKLLVPIAIYQIMQKKLTLVDITVDKSIGIRYKLAKQIYFSYTDDFEFARTFKKIEYNPNQLKWREKRIENPASFWRQGLPMGLLDKTVDVLIEKEEDGKERVISYGEFEKKLAKVGSDSFEDINLASDIFLNFNPQTRPVLWRVLIAQVLLLKTLLKLKAIKPECINEKVVQELLLNYDDETVAGLNWSEDKKKKEEFEEPFKVAVEYLRSRF